MNKASRMYEEHLKHLKGEYLEVFRETTSYEEIIPADMLSYDIERYDLARRLYEAQEAGISALEAVGGDPYEYALSFRHRRLKGAAIVRLIELLFPALVIISAYLINTAAVNIAPSFEPGARIMRLLEKLRSGPALQMWLICYTGIFYVQAALFGAARSALLKRKKTGKLKLINKAAELLIIPDIIAVACLIFLNRTLYASINPVLGFAALLAAGVPYILLYTVRRQTADARLQADTMKAPEDKSSKSEKVMSRIKEFFAIDENSIK